MAAFLLSTLIALSNKVAINHTIHQLPVTLSSREIDGRRANQLRLSSKAPFLAPRPFLTVSEEEKCEFFSLFLSF